MSDHVCGLTPGRVPHSVRQETEWGPGPNRLHVLFLNTKSPTKWYEVFSSAVDS